MKNSQQGSKFASTGRHTRRWFLQLGLIGVGSVVGGLGASGLYSAAIAPYDPVIERVEISLPGFPAGAEPLRAVQLSDIHISSRFTAGDIRRAVEIANSLKPDVVVLTGDFAYNDLGLVPDAAVELGRLRARLGRYAVLGNHDHWTDAALVGGELRRNGIELLTNTATRVDIGTNLWLAGVDDVWAGRPDLSRALKPIPDSAPAILLCHEPDFADNVPARVGLQLSGHTHGGQVRIPGVGPILPKYGVKYQAGLYHAARTTVYTNRGIGLINPPLRLNCPPEVTLLTLDGHLQRA